MFNFTPFMALFLLFPIFLWLFPIYFFHHFAISEFGLVIDHLNRILLGIHEGLVFLICFIFLCFLIIFNQLLNKYWIWGYWIFLYNRYGIHGCSLTMLLNAISIGAYNDEFIPNNYLIFWTVVFYLFLFIIIVPTLFKVPNIFMLEDFTVLSKLFRVV